MSAATTTHDAREFITHHAIELADTIPDAVQVVSTDGAFLYVNQAWTTQLGYNAEDVRGMTFLDVIHPDHQSAWKQVFKTVLGGKALHHFEMVLVAQDGAAVPVEGSIWALVSKGRPYAVCAAVRNSADRTIGEQLVSRAMYRDELTGMFNNKGFLVRATRLLEVIEDNKDRVGGWLLYLDIDNLEQVQRRHGDEAMNEAVLRTAQMLHKTLRVHDVVARVTRSGFAAMISLPPRYPPNYITARIRGALQLANRHAAKQYNVELAMGLAQMAAHAPVQDALERAAAEAALTAPGRQRAPLA